MSSPTDLKLSSETSAVISLDSVKPKERIVDGGRNGWMTVTGSYMYSFGAFQDGRMFMLSLATPDRFYQVFLSQGLGIGVGMGLIFTPASAIIGHHFKKRKVLAYGIAMSGSSIGAIFFPIVLNHILPRFGFANSVHITAYISLGGLILGNILIRPVRIPRSGTRQDIKGFFKDLHIWHSSSALLEQQSGVLLCSNSEWLWCPKKIVMNYLADIYGVWDIHLAMTLAAGAMIWAILGLSSSASLIVVSVLYGISSGAWLALIIPMLATLASSPSEIGARMGVDGYALSSMDDSVMAAGAYRVLMRTILMAQG
ncbi:hypothetical protein BU17DRAFT_61867 [Hysterangium stoloniferum]|nr:hypothetical protein BU17DRAFT_61867 [Hysterangium stoloniferum]